MSNKKHLSASGKRIVGLLLSAVLLLTALSGCKNETDPTTDAAVSTQSSAVSEQQPSDSKSDTTAAESEEPQSTSKSDVSVPSSAESE